MTTGRTYRCPACGKNKSKEVMFTKTIVFRKLGEMNPVKARTYDWVCSDCLPSDEHWNIPERSSPGGRSEAKQRAEAVREAARTDLKNKIFGGSIE